MTRPSAELTAQIQAAADAEHARQGACSWCGLPGESYEHNGVLFDGLTACEGDRLCGKCKDRYLAGTPLLIAATDHGVTRVYDINPSTATEETEPPAQAIAAAYRYADWRPPTRRSRRA
jgi:hypothetical protein